MLSRRLANAFFMCAVFSHHFASAQVELETLELEADEILSPLPSRPRTLLNAAVPGSTADLLPSLDLLKTDWNVEQEEILWGTAITLAELSTLAYTDEHNREVMLRLLGFGEVVTLDDGPMSGFIAFTDDVVVVSFRGTDMFSPNDWLANIDFRQKSMGHGRKLHRGFQNSYERFADEIKAHLRDHNPSFIWLTGHSLGGSMATCCAYDWIVHRMPMTGLITFGQPRVGNRIMAEFLDQQIGNRYLRFLNGDDIVPNVPPANSRLLPDYWHAGQSAWFKGGDLDRIKRRAARGAADEQSETLGDMIDAAEDVSAEELIILQNYLRAIQPPEVAERIPDLLKGETPILYGGPVGGVVPHGGAMRFSSEEVIVATGIMSRFGDHSMLEYLRKLNEFMRVEDGP